MKKTLSYTFTILLIVYTILVSLSYFNIISRYTLHFEIFALLLAVLAIFLFKDNKSFKLNKWLILIPLFLILFLRIIPYVNNDIPLGYDTGIYKNIMETYKDNLPNIPEFQLDTWVRANHEHGLFVFTDVLYLIGFNTNTILTYFLIFLELLLGLTIYITTKKFFNKNTAIIALFLYALSITQFKTFEYMYYKNILGLIFLLTAFFFLKSKKYVPFIISGIFLAVLHRPTFLVFLLSYFVYSILNLKAWKSNLISGLSIAVLAFPFYMHRLNEMIISNVEPLIEANIGAGTFISFFQYQFFILAYLPFAFLGAFYLIKKKDYNVLLIWFIINFVIVFFKIIFYNRFIIHLDIVMIILASLGIVFLIENKKLIGTLCISILLISSFFIVLNDSLTIKPLIDNEEMNSIQSLSKTEENSFAMSTTSYYSPWILGYSGRKTIAPGLFDYDQWTREEWNIFYNTTDKKLIISMFSNYTAPIYLYVGKYQTDYIKNKPCFETYQDRIYRYVC